MNAKTQQEKPKVPQNDTPIRAKENNAQGGTATFEDNRIGLVSQRKLRAGMAESPRDEGTAQLRKGMQGSTSGASFPIQRKSNQTGLPDQLKSGIENLSGYSMDDVKVHFNSSKPAQLQAHAYAQGSEIHVAPGQEKHLPHEAWHVVQQKQGRVKPTRQLKSTVNINDDTGLEKEADVMGAKALGGQTVQREALSSKSIAGETVQMERYADLVNQYSDPQNGNRVLVIELNMAGSANEYPASSDKADNYLRIKGKDKVAYSATENTDERQFYRMQFNFEGPGGPHTTGFGSIFRGLKDGGSNSINSLIKFIPRFVHDMVEEMEEEEAWEKVVVLINAHSRGAVAAYDVAHHLKNEHPDWHVELSQFDPVPGPGQRRKKKHGYHPERDHGENGHRTEPLDEHSVIYSVASGWFKRFKPMYLYTMTRLIITGEDHSAGVGMEFSYQGQIYQRGELNRLGRGIYVERAIADNRGRVVLRKATSREQAKAWYEEILPLSIYQGDIGRRGVIYAAIDTIQQL